MKYLSALARPWRLTLSWFCYFWAAYGIWISRHWWVITLAVLLANVGHGLVEWELSSRLKRSVEAITRQAFDAGCKVTADYLITEAQRRSMNFAAHTAQPSKESVKC